MRRSIRDGLIGNGGTGMLLALDTILPGFWRANSASVWTQDNVNKIIQEYYYFIEKRTNNSITYLLFTS